ncbi:cob(I)yrinic acid a,c-diamide adenosyltransferase [Nitrincola tapanii]|jgi:cob(I)alamin adenosyltransferase|uniref:Corrinoid adenosyltransferase n=1 Tax=Nitrincola tapanii TaxID=1708751 RepID=A0A5A9W0Q7_9GAMM|nr:cob(I)yrinic acid a,c-diamide adenosyltransferase [Nitrincola tapanii]KAA0874074.1 cob(I)yrinic acid a,c-diamide adenosyltransferase [Nitrincola tapanii]
MSDRLDRIYTRSGDKGTTGLANGKRLPKSHPRIEALGDVDELNSLIGLLNAELKPQHRLHASLQQIQNDLFDLGGELAIADPDYTVIRLERIQELELFLDQLNEALPPLREFILPGGSHAAASAHFARSVCRRAERRLVELAATDGEILNPLGAAYLNRLSDLLFVVARTLAREQGGQEIFWKPTQPISE